MLPHALHPHWEGSDSAVLLSPTRLVNRLRLEGGPTARLFDPTAQDSGEQRGSLEFLEDEQLVLLVQRRDSREARDELLRRTTAQRKKQIRQLSRGAGLDEADRMDAEQDAVFWTLEAIRQYRRAENERGTCRFRTFLHRVTACRFADSLRRRVRYRRHFVQLGHATPSEPSRSGEFRQRDNPAEQPVDEATRVGGFVAQLQQQLDGLGGEVQSLALLLVAGHTLTEISAALNISYDAAKRQRRKILLRLRASLERSP